MPGDTESRLVAALSRGGEPSSDFELDSRQEPATAGRLRPAGVLIGVDLTRDRPEVILTRRALRLRHHPGQIALPGGGQESGDPDVIATALREAREEIGLPESDALVLGELPVHETVTGFRVTPVVALIERPFTMRLDQGEVEEAFRVPLDHLLDLRQYRIEGRVWDGRKRHYHVVPWGPYYIWGATARILRGLAERAR